MLTQEYFLFPPFKSDRTKKSTPKGVDFLVLVIGLEPIRIISPRDFKSLVSAYSTTPANKTGNSLSRYPMVTRTGFEPVLPP